MNPCETQCQILSTKNMIKFVFFIFFPFVSHAVSCDGRWKNLSGDIKQIQEDAHKGDADAQFKLAQMYREGEGVKQDLDQAIYWVKKSAEQEYSPAQEYLSKLYYHGEGVERNLPEAFRLTQKAAQQGNIDAQNRLAHMYRKGEGVWINIPEAIRWYKKAAKQGDEYAQLDLGEMYYEGKAVEEDPNLASFWTQTANETESMYMMGMGNNKGEDQDKKIH